MFYIDSFFINNSINLNSNSIGKIFKNFLHNEENPLNNEEEFLFNYISHLNKARFLKKSNSSKRAWEKIKTSKDKAGKEEITQSEKAKKLLQNNNYLNRIQQI